MGKAMLPLTRSAVLLTRVHVAVPVLLAKPYKGAQAKELERVRSTPEEKTRRR